MSTWQVIEILSANTVRVAPGWTVTLNGQLLSDDKVRISGLNVPFNNDYVRHRLTSFLLHKGVQLLNPTPLENRDATQAQISCNVILDGTDITYYFPEFKSGLPVVG